MPLSTTQHMWASSDAPGTWHRAKVCGCEPLSSSWQRIPPRRTSGRTASVRETPLVVGQAAADWCAAGSPTANGVRHAAAGWYGASKPADDGCLRSSTAVEEAAVGRRRSTGSAAARAPTALPADDGQLTSAAAGMAAPAAGRGCGTGRSAGGTRWLAALGPA